MKWFGESWDAPVNEETERVETPVGNLCAQCDNPIRETDRGLIMPLIGNYVQTDIAWHLRCFLKNIGVL